MKIWGCVDFKNGCESLQDMESVRYGVKWYFELIGKKWLQVLILLTSWVIGCKSAFLRFEKVWGD